MTKIHYVAIGLAVFIAACATTGALLDNRPELADEVQILTVAANCVDAAVAAAINETPWENILGSALGCAASIFKGDALGKAQLAVKAGVHARKRAAIEFKSRAAGKPAVGDLFPSPAVTPNPYTEAFPLELKLKP